MNKEEIKEFLDDYEYGMCRTEGKSKEVLKERMIDNLYDKIKNIEINWKYAWACECGNIIDNTRNKWTPWLRYRCPKCHKDVRKVGKYDFINIK